MNFRQVAPPLVSSLLLVMPSTASGERCMKDEVVSKTCPDFLDKPDEVYCCPSKTVVGSFFCCSADFRDTLLRKDGHSTTDIPTVVGASLAGVFGALLLLLLMCYYCNCCLLYRSRHRRKRDATLLKDGSQCENVDEPLPQGRYPSSRISMYHRVTTTPAQEPRFEAPPPYDVAEKYPKNPPVLVSTSADAYMQQNQDNEHRCAITPPMPHQLQLHTES